jgi:drug/metabolite transporter (DMT)-like permease
MNRRAAAAADNAAHDHANRAGILTMIGAMACFIANDSLVKYASQTMSTAQLIFVRGVMASTLVLGVARAMGATGRIREIARGWVATRAVVDAAASVLFIVSLFHLPIGAATAINMTSPLIITVLAALIVGERVGLPSWLATGVGFVGVLLIIQPRSEAFNGYAIVCFIATILLSIRDLVTRRVHAAIPSILVTLSTTVAVTVLAGAVVLIQGWNPLVALDLVLLAVAAVFLAGGYYLLINSTRKGNISLVAPFRYTGLLFATAIGYVVWGDVPNALAWFGIVLLVGSGIYVLRASRRARAVAPTPD